MSDTDATRRRHRVADPLRELVGSLFTNDMALYKDFMSIADQIDREHERRMEQARKDSRKATCNYMSRIVADYKRGVRRSVRSKATKISRGTGEYGHVSCSSCGETVQRCDHYCWHCGSMLKDGKH